jgi:hypothetical protein
MTPHALVNFARRLMVNLGSPLTISAPAPHGNSKLGLAT